MLDTDQGRQVQYIYPISTGEIHVCKRSVREQLVWKQRLDSHIIITIQYNEKA